MNSQASACIELSHCILICGLCLLEMVHAVLYGGEGSLWPGNQRDRAYLDRLKSMTAQTMQILKSLPQSLNGWDTCEEAAIRTRPAGGLGGGRGSPFV